MTPVKSSGLAARIPSWPTNAFRLFVLLLALVLTLGVLNWWFRTPLLVAKRGEWNRHRPAHVHQNKPSSNAGASNRPSKSSKHRAILEAGRLWYRYGKPFNPIPLHHVAIGFNTASVRRPSLLFYGQLLSGVFSASQEQYAALILKNGGLPVKTKRSTAHGENSIVQIMNIPNQIKAGTWYVACFSIAPKLAMNVVKVNTSIKDKLGMWRKNCKWESQSAGISQMTGKTRGTNFVIDSGLYFGAVVDVRNAPGLTSEPGLGAFQGGIVSTFILNKKKVHLDTDSHGPPAENWESSLARLDLSLPIVATPSKASTRLDGVSFQKFPIVSAVSQDHAVEVHDMISSAVVKMPKRGIIAYDMGLSVNTSGEIASLCNVAIRFYRRDLFPQLLQHLFHYRWKAPLVYGAFLEFGGVIWSDASIRFRYQLQHIPLVRNGYGFVGFQDPGSNPTGSFTHKGTLDSLGVPRSVIALSDMTIGGLHIWLGEGSVCEVALEYWVRCSFVKECMAPEGTKKDYNLCRMKEKPYGNFIGCHRFDQSALSVIMAKIFPGKITSNYLVRTRELAAIRRWRTESYPRCYASALL